MDSTPRLDSAEQLAATARRLRLLILSLHTVPWTSLTEPAAPIPPGGDPPARDPRPTPLERLEAVLAQVRAGVAAGERARLRGDPRQPAGADPT